MKKSPSGETERKAARMMKPNNVKKFAVVKFLDDNTVDAVPTNWIEKTDKAVYCYWPQKNVSAKVKKREIPDKTRWARCKVTVLTCKDDYKKAREKVKQATVTSNMESDEEVPLIWKTGAPVRYLDSETDIDEPSTSKIKRKTHPSGMKNQTLSEPQMPTISPFNPSKDLFAATDNDSSSTLPTRTTDMSTSQTGASSSGQGPAIISTQNTAPCIQNETSTPAFIRPILMRLDKIEESLEMIKSILTKDMRSDYPEFEELTRPVSTPGELEILSEKLKDAAHRQKVIDYLSLLGGKSTGDSIRRIMRKIGTNALWANYSMKGRKGKQNFQELAICQVIIMACRKNHPQVLQKAIEEAIADTLRYAPHRGTKRDRDTSQEDSTIRHQEDDPEDHTPQLDSD